MALFYLVPAVVKLPIDFVLLIPTHRLVRLVLVVPKRLPSRLAILHIIGGVFGVKLTVVHASYPSGFSSLSSP